MHQMDLAQQRTLSETRDNRLTSSSSRNRLDKQAVSDECETS